MEQDVALVLAGGGAKGAYQAEVASRILEKENVTAITGVSAGALNGALLSERNPQKIRSIWKRTRREDVWKGGKNFFRYLSLIFGDAKGLFDPSPLLETVKQNFNPNDAQIPFEAGAVSLDSGEYVSYQIDPNKTYTDGQIKKARRFVVASSAIPVAVEPVEVGGKLLVDGGIRNVAAARQAVEYDPDRIIAIFNSQIAEHTTDHRRRPTSVFEVGKIAFEIAMNETIRSDVEAAKALNNSKPQYKQIPVDIIEPSDPLGSPKDFSKSAYEKRRKIGIRDFRLYVTDT